MNFGSAASSFAFCVGYVPGACPGVCVGSLVVPAGGPGGITRASSITMASASSVRAVVSVLRAYMEYAATPPPTTTTNATRARRFFWFCSTQACTLVSAMASSLSLR